MAVGCAGVLAGAPAALAHELECVKEVNGEKFLEVDRFPTTLEYRLVVRNIHPESPSDALSASDPLLDALGFEGFAVPFTVPVGGEVEKNFRVPLENLEACLQLAAMDGSEDEFIDNAFRVAWDTGSDVCTARVECVAPPPKPQPQGQRMTGGGSVFTADGMRVTHGFQVRCDAADPRQNLQINWDGNRFHLLELDSATCLDTDLDERPPAAGFDTFIGAGTGRYNGVDGATIDFTFTDDGEPGVDDTARIVIRDAEGSVVLEVEGSLQFGNHQAHRR